jgi:Ulp1 family protease
VGKRKAEVEAHDLERLRDNEFLNDNLIGFYLRFLEHHLERTRQDVARKVYFFNSYFFASLTNTPKGKRGINYPAVQKWTRAVDIFSYDYVVVPINENAHWYVAIICNLPSLRREISTPRSVELVKVGDEDHPPTRASDARDSIHPGGTIVSLDDGGKGTQSGEDLALENGKEEHLQKSFTSMTLSDKEPEIFSPSHTAPQQTSDPADNEDWPEEDENQAPSSPIRISMINTQQQVDENSDKEVYKLVQGVKPGIPGPVKKTSQKSRASLPKFDAKQPIIITFDSLGCSRSPTIRILREYLEEEGKSKGSFKLDAKGIKGMTAQQIPLQLNYSDCGLYLLAYLEKFVQDPDQFITKLLRREMDEKADWPQMESHVLRRRLRQFLLNLHNEQEGARRYKSNEAPMMVDSKPLRILLREVDARISMEQVAPAVSKQKSPEPELSPHFNFPLEGNIQDSKRRVKQSPQQIVPTRSSPRLNRKELKPGPESLLVNSETTSPKSADNLFDGLMEVIQNECSTRKPSIDNNESVVEIPGTPPRRERADSK